MKKSRERNQSDTGERGELGGDALFIKVPSKEGGLPAELCDEITGLPNAMLFQDRFHTAVHRVGRLGFGIGMGILELDGFGDLEKSWAPDKLNQFLCSVVDQLSNKIRRSDTLARIGMAKFALIFENISEEKVLQRLAEKCLEAVSEPLFTMSDDGSSKYVQARACFGLCLFPFHITDFEKVIPACEEALNAAKEKGGGWVLY